MKLENNLITEIEECMQTDDQDRDDQQEVLFNHYDTWNNEQKAAVDDLLVCICGWSLESLIERCNPIKGADHE